MNARTINERVAVLETKVDSLQESLDEHKEEITRKVDAIAATLSVIDRDLVRYRGVWGGVMLVAGGVSAALLLLKDSITNLFSRWFS